MTTLEEVYQRRAAQLARRPETVSAATLTPVLVFGLAGERYGVELADLAEVFPFRGCTAVPGAPAAVLGVINVRGDIKPLADLRRILELPTSPGAASDGPGYLAPGVNGYVLMLRRAIGLRVERVDGVRHIETSGMTPGSRFVKGVTADSVIVIDTEAVFSTLK